MLLKAIGDTHRSYVVVQDDDSRLYNRNRKFFILSPTIPNDTVSRSHPSPKFKEANPGNLSPTPSRQLIPAQPNPLNSPNGSDGCNVIQNMEGYLCNKQR